MRGAAVGARNVAMLGKGRKFLLPSSARDNLLCLGVFFAWPGNDDEDDSMPLSPTSFSSRCRWRTLGKLENQLDR